MESTFCFVLAGMILFDILFYATLAGCVGCRIAKASAVYCVEAFDEVACGYLQSDVF